MYLKQCVAPFREDVEPALRWRFFPQLFVWALGGSRWVALAVPWLGAWALLAYIFQFARNRGTDERTSFYLTLLVGASAPVLVSTGWAGINDAWVALGLCYLAFGCRKTLLALACVVCPFIDERFVFGIPGALALRHFELAQTGLARACGRVVIQCLAAAAPFLVVRLAGASLGRSADADERFILNSIRASSAYLAMAPLGALMAFRFAYVPAVRQALELWRAHRIAVVLLAVATVGPVAAGFLVASDTLRTAGILLPLCLWGAVHQAQSPDARQLRVLALCGLIFPAAHITYTKVFLINNLPLELWRLLN